MKRTFPVFVLLLVFLLLFSQGTAVCLVTSGHVEKSSKNPGDEKKGEEAFLLLSASATISSFHIHFDHVCKIIFGIPVLKITGLRVIRHFPEFFNDYFQTLFQFIIATKAP